RAWTMAEHEGSVFCSTLPSGKVFAFQAGRSVSWGHSFPAGWHHVAAVRSQDRLRLYVDGRQVAESSAFDASAYSLDSDVPLRIGAGQSVYLHGRLADLRLYNHSLVPDVIRRLARAEGAE